MFAAAMLDAFPSLGDDLLPALRAAGLAADVTVRWERVVDEVLAGSRFVVDDPRERRAPRPRSVVLLPSSLGPGHDHVPYRSIRVRIEQSGLPTSVIARALDIFAHLARAEASVHGVDDVDAVEFHEVGAQDSVADIVAAAWLIERANVVSWSCSSIPMGSGTITTAHGVLPIPAPATAMLLEGFPVHDDGRMGERVTPTGAAIIRHLSPSAKKPSGVLGKTGIGWGTKRFAGLANVLRVLELSGTSGPAQASRDEVTRLAFEIDDQPAEDLAVALERLRALEGVLDVLQAPAFGKKGRMVAQVRVLCLPHVEDAVVQTCLLETTTLGVRMERRARVILAREEIVVDGVRGKRAARPDGSTTIKAEMDDVASAGDAAARRAKKLRTESP